MLNGLFFDPVMFNMVNLYIFKDVNKKIAGINYINERYIPFAINLYNVNRKIKLQNNRGYGLKLEVYGPILKKGRDILKVSLKQYLDDKNKKKHPTSILLHHTYKEKFPLADYNYKLSDTKAVVKYDRGDKIYRINYIASKDIFNELFIDIDVNILQSSTSTLTDQRGIEIVNDKLEEKLDDTNLFIEGLDNGFYVKNIKKLSVGLAKTFRFNHYFSKFPLSLRKESLFLKYNHYNLETSKNFIIKESIVGIKFDMLYFHKLPIPTTIKYIENDFSKDDYKITLTLGMEF
jgi:hypothetical protein